MENLYLDNALQNYLDNDSYHKIIMIYAHFLNFYSYKIALYTNTSVCLHYNSIQKFTIITIIRLLSLL